MTCTVSVCGYCVGMVVKTIAKKIQKHKDAKEGGVVAVVRLEGPIGVNVPGRGGISADTVDDLLKRAFEHDDTRAVAIAVNSPGGAPGQSEIIAQRIRFLADKHKKPVLAFCEDVAASGGYWLALAADEIYALTTSIVGSIGVVSAGFGLEDFITRYDIKRRVITSGENKHRLDPFIEPSEEDTEWLRGIQRDLHRVFEEWVKERRGTKLVSDEDLFTGDIWIGEQAKARGLIDDMGSLDVVIGKKFPKAKITVLAPRKPLLQRLTSASAEGAADGALRIVQSQGMWARFGL